jgi:signal transduction histidine kinase/ActR/RegA family two-component response regulator
MHRCGRLDEAIECTRQAASIFHRLQRDLDEGYCLFNLATHLDLKGEAEQSIPVLNEALALAEKVAKPRLIAYCLGQLGVAHSRIGQAAKAEEYHVQALGYAESLADPVLIAWTRYHIAECKKERGFAEDAEPHYEAALAIAERAGLLDCQAQCLEGQARISEDHNDCKQALAQLRAAHQIKERMLLEAGDRNLQRLQTIMELDRTRREKHLLEVAKEELTRTVEERTRELSAAVGRLEEEIAVRREEMVVRLNLERELQQAQKMEAVGLLAAGIAHDFNNILASIRGNAGLARSDIDSEHPAQESLIEIEKSTTRAREIVQQILLFSRKESVSRAALDLGTATEAALRQLLVTLPAGIEIRAACEEGLPKVNANSTAVQQIVTNLATNASHAMGGVGILGVSVDSVVVDEAMAARVPALHSGQYVRLRVRDSGHGMTPEVLEHIFEPFYTTKGPGEGTGLGLAVVHGIVRDHEGAIRVTSEPGRGTEFEVYFPALPTAQAVAEPTPAPARASATGAATSDGAGRHVLLVDDDEALVFLSRRTLERMGYRVEGFTEPEEALAAFKAAPASFDAVVADMAMPKMSGLELARKLLAARSDVPIILLSGYIRDSDEVRARELGVREVHWKPSTVSELGETLHRCLAQIESQP